jgi:hypothetical protein
MGRGRDRRIDSRCFENDLRGKIPVRFLKKETERGETENRDERREKKRETDRNLNLQTT